MVLEATMAIGTVATTTTETTNINGGVHQVVHLHRHHPHPQATAAFVAVVPEVWMKSTSCVKVKGREGKLAGIIQGNTGSAGDPLPVVTIVDDAGVVNVILHIIEMIVHN